MSVSQNTALQINSKYDTMVPNSNNVKGVSEYGIDTRSGVHQNGIRYSQMQTGERTQGMDEGLYRASLEERRTGQPITRRHRPTETRTLEILVNDSKFERLSGFVGNEISRGIYDTLVQQYAGDIRPISG